MAAVKELDDPGKGYFKKNFARLKEFQHMFYMLSRIVMFVTGLVLTGFYLFDAWYFHDPKGVPDKYLYVVGMIFFANGLRKFVIRLIMMGENAESFNYVIEQPRDPRESWWMIAGFRLPFFIRRGLVGVIALTTEAFAAGLMLFAWISVGIKHGLFLLSWQFPFVFKPVALTDWSFPENTSTAIMIALVALLISWFNHSVFVFRYPKVRRSALSLVYQAGQILPDPLDKLVTKLFEIGNKLGKKEMGDVERAALMEEVSILNKRIADLAGKRQPDGEGEK